MPASSPTTSVKNGPAPGKEVPAVSVRGVTVDYGGPPVVEDVDFEVAQGSVAAIIGPNGSGKTTLLKAVLGLIPYQAGDIRVFGQPLHGVRQMIGYVPQRFEFDRDFPITVREFMELSRQARCPRHFPPEKIEEKIREVGLPAEILDRHLGRLSGGQLQRVLIAQAIISDPPLLFLDEPAANIDIAGEKTLYGIIEHLNKEHRTTIIMITHDIGMIAHVVDTVICVNRRMMCYGSPRTALTERKLNEIFGHEHGLYEHPAHDEPAERRPHRGHRHPDER